MSAMDLFSLIAYVLPAYFANASPVIFGGGKPLDGKGKFIDGKRMLGNNKTVKGSIAGLATGTVVGTLIAILIPSILPQFSTNRKILLAFLLSAGAVFGDLLGSFIKRRLGKKSGEQLVPLDQILFVLCAIVFATVAYIPSLEDTFLLLVITLALHVFFNALAHKLGLKNVPW